MAFIQVQLRWNARKAILVKADKGPIIENEAYPSMILDLDRHGDRPATPEEAFEMIAEALRVSGSATPADTIENYLVPEN
jgi:hypothetical protein